MWSGSGRAEVNLDRRGDRFRRRLFQEPYGAWTVSRSSRRLYLDTVTFGGAGPEGSARSAPGQHRDRADRREFTRRGYRGSRASGPLAVHAGWSQDEGGRHRRRRRVGDRSCPADREGRFDREIKTYRRRRDTFQPSGVTLGADYRRRPRRRARRADGLPRSRPLPRPTRLVRYGGPSAGLGQLRPDRCLERPAWIRLRCSDP